ncbi:hypothetical protein [Intrasporangium sp.]|uniref:hypothetical protein n=1 Tax=Intrasporangium sp. TaxID=1925024 RepID=UPI0032213B27
MTLDQFRAAFVVATRSHNALASPATASVGLGVVPIMQTLPVVGAVGAAGGQNLAMTAQATILVGTVTFVAASIAVQSSMDRVIGVAAYVVPHGLLRPSMFTGKIVLAALLSLPATAVQLFGVSLTGASVWRTALLVPAALLCGSALGVGISLWSLSAKDPFAVANLAPYLLPVTSGAAVPLATFPVQLQVISAAIPGTGLAQAARGVVPPGVGMLWDLASSTGWLLVTLARAKSISARVRDGQLTSEVL